MKLIYKYKNSFKYNCAGFKIIIDDEFKDDIQIHDIDVEDNILNTTTIKIPSSFIISPFRDDFIVPIFYFF